MAQLQVFLCHSSADKPIVRALYRRLRADGLQPWLDEEDILPGQNWEAEIRKAIRRCDVVIVCLTEASISRVGFLQKEIRSVLDVADEQPEDTIFVIPARLEACEVPDRLRKWQWVDLFQNNGYGLLIRALSTRSKALYAEPLQRSIVSIKQDPKPFHETMQGAVGVAEQQVRSGYSIPTGLRFDGLYVQESTNPIPHASYIRLHPNGLIFVVSSTATAEHVFKWLATESEQISKGRYTITANRINFSTVSSSGQVDYSGTIEGDGRELHLHTYSRINSNEAYGVWRYTALASTESRGRPAKPPLVPTPPLQRPGHLPKRPSVVKAFRHGDKEVKGLAFSPDGSLLATGGGDGTARLWGDVTSGKERRRIPHDGRVTSVAFSPDGGLLATACWDDETARVWDATSGQERFAIPQGSRVASVAFSPDRGLLATGTENSGARIWDVASQEQHPKVVHGLEVKTAVTSVAFSPDGRLLATGSADGAARTWDVASWQQHAEMGHFRQVMSVAFSPNRGLLATGSADGIVGIWPVT